MDSILRMVFHGSNGPRGPKLRRCTSCRTGLERPYWTQSTIVQIWVSLDLIRDGWKDRIPTETRSHRNGLGLSGILRIPPFVWIRRGFDRKQRAVFEDTINLNLGTEENARNIPIGPALSPKEKEDLTRRLLDYKEFCAWSYEDMPGLYSDLVEHRLPPETSPSSKSFGGYILIWT